MTLPRFNALKPGDRAEVTRRYLDDDIAEWCRLAEFDGDWETVPEPLIAALFSYLLGEELPGHGTNYLKQSMRFHGHGRPGEALTASVAVTRLRQDKALVNLETRCLGEDGRLLCDGEALVLFQC
ncbi:MAG: hypothetical protein ABGX87_08360 [Alcanivorax sp.]|uniref:Acyl dehydratase n=1 Tax=Alloalcanivorax marinus TaxID=1177169 RepID=A0A9Q3YQJ4_9GAMM|nr:hypothetical protein [Alloalcanivorax marinus]MBM7334713.1 hypothetical protein [Alloalcanivorax marinus]MCC4307683.1 hypothetical protein [Alloalcanivorax marinus]